MEKGAQDAQLMGYTEKAIEVATLQF